MTGVRPAPVTLGVSRETVDLLEAYVDLIVKWSPRINLVSKSSLDAVWQRHIVDSIQVSSTAPQNADTWADLGSGGGLPGIVVSILRPETKMTLVESDQRKATFLRTCIHTLGLNAQISSQRIEQVPPLNVTIVSARALAPLPLLLGYASRHLAPDGIAILPKGRKAEQELAEARKTWSFHCTQTPSQTESEAQILRIERITRV